MVGYVFGVDPDGFIRHVRGRKADFVEHALHDGLKPARAYSAHITANSGQMLMMFMTRFIEEVDRGQSTLFPESLEDWIDADNPVRVIAVFVDELDLGDVGFVRAAPEANWQGARL